MESREQTEQAAARWIARRDTGPWTQDDAAALDAWLAQSAGHRAAYYRLNAAWQEAGRLKALVGGRVPVTPKPWARSYRMFAMAAGLLLVVGSVLFAYRYMPFGRDSYATVVGGLEAVPLPDGSKITLNTNSRIRVVLDERERRVDLRQGEAFFEVAKDPNRPFVVSAGDQRIIAVGTAFSVRREGDNVRVIVSEGTVRMEHSGNERSLPQPLTAGSIVRAHRDDVLVQIGPPNEVEMRLSWRSGLLTFRDTPLAEAVTEFNRYNTRKIEVEDPKVAAIEIGGVFRASNVDSFLHLLEEGFPIRASVEQDRIVLQSRSAN